MDFVRTPTTHTLRTIEIELVVGPGNVTNFWGRAQSINDHLLFPFKNGQIVL